MLLFTYFSYEAVIAVSIEQMLYMILTALAQALRLAEEQLREAQRRAYKVLALHKKCASWRRLKQLVSPAML